MPKVTVTGYMNTGFGPAAGDFVNMPYSPQVLQSADSKEFAATYQWQLAYLDHLDVKGRFEEFENVDYIKINDQYYFAGRPVMLGLETCRIPLVYDPITSAGGFAALNIISGWVTRVHTNKDDPYTNTLPEPVSLKRPPVIHTKAILNANEPMSSEADIANLSFVAATVDLRETVEYAKRLKVRASSETEETGAEMLIPELPPEVKTPTAFSKGSTYDGETRQYYTRIPGVAVFNLKNETIQANLTAVRETGIEGAIIAMYNIPARNVTAMGTDDGLVTSMIGLTAPYQVGDFVLGEFKNQKTNQMYNTFTIVSITSNAQITFDAQDLYDGAEHPTFITIVDPAPGGGVSLQPTKYKKQMPLLNEHCVSSLPWLNAGYMYNGASGSLLTTVNAKYKAHLEKTQLDRWVAANEAGDIRRAWSSGWAGAGAAANLGISAAGAYAGVTGPMSEAMFSLENPQALNNATGVAAPGAGAFGTVGRLFDAVLGGREAGITQANEVAAAQERVNSHARDAMLSMSTQAPTTDFPVEINAASYYGMGFVVMQVTPDPKDLADIDRRLTAIGYNYDGPYETGMFNRRKHFTTIQFGEVKISNDMPTIQRTVAQSLLMAGVRIWKELPNEAAYDSNPIGG